MINDGIGEAIRYRYALLSMVKTELKVRYRRSFLGFLWSLLHPLLTMTVTSIVFSYIMRFELEQFVIFLFSGLLPFSFCSQSISLSSNSIINNEGFIKKIYMPKLIFPLVTILSNFINFILSMTCLFIIGTFIGIKVTQALFFIPFSLFLLLCFTLGGALITSSSVVFYRDLSHIYDVILATLFYATPILYPLKFLPIGLQTILKYNPFYYIVELFRKPIFENIVPGWDIIIGGIFVSVMFLIVGYTMFMSLERRFVFRL
jgi:ABC-2 type transport system permease protein/lipopolysaccharide transport system permease protein